MDNLEGLEGHSVDMCLPKSFLEVVLRGELGSPHVSRGLSGIIFRSDMISPCVPEAQVERMLLSFLSSVSRKTSTKESSP